LVPFAAASLAAAPSLSFFREVAVDEAFFREVAFFRPVAFAGVALLLGEVPFELRELPLDFRLELPLDFRLLLLDFLLFVAWAIRALLSILCWSRTPAGLG